MKSKIVVFLVLAFVCLAKNKTFSNNYKLTYLKIPAVDITFSAVDTVKIGEKKALKFVGKAKTSGFFNYVFQLQNTYETFIDLETQRPLKFTKNCVQTNINQNLTITYDWQKNTAKYSFSFGKTIEKQIPTDVIDFMTMILQIQNAKLSPNDSLNFNLDVEGIFWHATAFAKPLQKILINNQTWETTPISIKFRQFVRGETREHKTDVVSNRVATNNVNLTLWVTKEKNPKIVKIIYELSPFDVNIVLVD